MSTILDLIGSIMLAGFVILLGLSLNQSISGQADAASTKVMAQESVVQIAQTLESDLRKISAISSADSSSIQFTADLNGNGTVVAVKWYVAASPVSYPNPGIKMVYRTVNGGTPLGMGLVTEFTLRYRDQASNFTTSIPQMVMIEPSVTTVSPLSVADDVLGYDKMVNSTASWRQTRMIARTTTRHI
jgi:hypothetical protein